MKRALVIGSSGGIGAALASQLRRDEVQVTGLSRRENGFDLTKPEIVDDALNALEPPFDMLIFAAGILAPPGTDPEKSLAAIDANKMAEVMAINAIGPALVLRHASRLLPRTGRSVVAILTARVGSIGDNALGGWYSYRASKAAANQITRTAAIEIGRRHKDAVVVAIHPGTVATEFTKSYPAHKKHQPEEAAENILRFLDGLTPDQSGMFFDWAGKPVPW